MISFKDFENICRAGIEIFPKLYPVLKTEDTEVFFDNIGEIKKTYSVLLDKYQYYQDYPRGDMSGFKDSVNYLMYCCEKTDIKITMDIEIDKIELTEENWSVYRKINPLFRLYYNGVELNGLLNL